MRFAPLTLGVGLLRSIGQGDGSDGSGGISPEDLQRCENDAATEIVASLAGIYDWSGWEADTPPVIAQIATLLGSANVKALQFFGVGYDVGAGVSGLRQWATEMLERLRAGKMEVVSSSGVIQQRTLRGLRGSISS